MSSGLKSINGGVNSLSFSRTSLSSNRTRSNSKAVLIALRLQGQAARNNQKPCKGFTHPTCFSSSMKHQASPTSSLRSDRARCPPLAQRLSWSATPPPVIRLLLRRLQPQLRALVDKAGWMPRRLNSLRGLSRGYGSTIWAREQYL